MLLNEKQTGVLKGMAAAACIALIGLLLAAFAPWSGGYTNLSQTGQVTHALSWEILVVLPLLFSIGSLARHRFFTPADTDGSGLTEGTAKASILQAILQNTLEQTVLAFITQTVWAVTMPPSVLGVIPVAAFMFVTGRIAFVLGYRHGAPARSFGFALTFYPSAMMLVTMAGYILVRVIA